MPKTVKNCHGVLHSALDRAVKVGYIRFNPATSCELPRIEKPELKPLDDEEIKLFLKTIKGHRLERIFFVAPFTGMRQGEVLGLAWNSVDFARNTIYVRQQLQRERDGSGEYHLASPKNGKGRVLTVAPYVMAILREQQEWQARQKAALGNAWEESNLVFTNEVGHYLSAQIVYKEFKRIVTSIGCKETRFHDLRHSYAVAAIQSGDDIKTLQENLGHYCAAFTLDTYAHVSASMKTASAQRMENFIKSVT